MRELTSVLFILPAVLGMQWSATLQEGTTVDVCVGDSAYLPWAYTLVGSERVMDVEWYYQSPGGQQEVFASFIAGRLLTPRQDVEHVPNAGLLIHQVTGSEAGNYSVHINVMTSSGVLTTNTHTANVVVAVAPTTSEGRLNVHLRSGARKDQRTGLWFIELACGHFTDLGQPPVDISWTDPSGHMHDSSFYDSSNGTFVLTLSDPIESGNYSCQLSHSTPAAKCVLADSPLLRPASLYVDGKDAKLSVLEAAQRDLLKQVGQLTADNTALRHTFDSLNNQARTCEAEKATLESQLQDLINRTGHRVSDQTQHPETCVDVQQYDNTSSVHTLFPRGHSPIAVYCDQHTDGGGWTVFQRRQDGSVDFYRNWTEYSDGFGQLTGEFWLGLENLHVLTSGRHQELRVDLEDWEGNKGYATYSDFWIADSSDNYTLHFDNFTGGNAGDGLSGHKGIPFSTLDADHDSGGGHCAVDYHGAWWYYGCHESNLNAEYKHSSSAPASDGLNWRPFLNRGTEYSMKFTEMKIRPM